MSTEQATELPAALAAILAEPGWWRNDVGDVWVWEMATTNGNPCIRVAFEDGGWWVTYETDGSTIMDLDTVLALLICMVRVHHAIGTALAHCVGAFAQLAALAEEERS